MVRVFRSIARRVGMVGALTIAVAAGGGGTPEAASCTTCWKGYPDSACIDQGSESLTLAMRRLLGVSRFRCSSAGRG